MNGIFETTLSTIFESPSTGNFNLVMQNRNEVDVLVKKNDTIIDDVTLSEDDGSDTHFRSLQISLKEGDVISAQASIPDEVRFTITD